MKRTAAVNEGRANIVALLHQLLQVWWCRKGSIVKLQASLHGNSLRWFRHSLPAGCCSGHAHAHTPTEQSLIHVC